jgi:hypothetical protein
MMDKHDSSSDTGFIRSYLYRGNEVLHVRLLVSRIAKSVYGHTHVVHWAGRNHREVELAIGAAEWWYWTEYEGRAVPIGILEEMRLAEGRTELDWAKRGVEVGSEGWSVLTEWVGDDKLGQIKLEIEE